MGPSFVEVSRSRSKSSLSFFYRFIVFRNSIEVSARITLRSPTPIFIFSYMNPTLFVSKTMKNRVLSIGNINAIIIPSRAEETLHTVDVGRK